VLSFPSGQESDWLGEMAISVDRAAVQSAAFSHTLFDELRILMLHGLLHLLGYDHEGDRGRMRRVETRWRARLELPAGLIERTRR
jgi:probable rRNA maturation factor